MAIIVNNDIKSRIGMAKKRMPDPVPIWRDTEDRAENGTRYRVGWGIAPRVGNICSCWMVIFI